MIAYWSGAEAMNSETGMSDAPRAKAILRDKLRPKFRRVKKLLSHPPNKLPMPPIAYGIQAKYPICLISRLRTSPRYLGSQKMKKNHAASVKNFTAINPQTCR